MATNHLLIEHASELAELAAECGIDWYGIKDLSAGKHSDLATIHKKYDKRCTMWVREFTDRSGDTQIGITFHTRKHGGVSRSWHSRKPGGFTARGSFPRRNMNREEEERRRRRELFSAYKKGWDEAQKVEAFPYLERKGITDIAKHFDMRVSTDRKVLGNGRGSLTPFLCFPLHSPEGHYVGLQRIYVDGGKKLTAGVADGHYVGAHAIIGDPEAGEPLEPGDTWPPIYVAEGFATAASVFLATGCATVFAYSADNLDPVCAHLSSRFPGRPIVIAADNDWTPKGNTGVFKALEAAQKNRVNGLGLRIIVPPLIGNDKTDFNDVHVRLGLDHLRTVIDDHSNSARPSRDRAEFLFDLLCHAHTEQIAAIARRLAVVLRAPHFISEEKLRELIAIRAGDRADRRKIAKAIRAVVVAGTYKAQKIATIHRGSVQTWRQFLTVKNDAGHLVISTAAVEAALEELRNGHIVIFKSPMGSGKTEILIRRAMASVCRAAHILPRVSVVDDAAGRLDLAHYREVDGFQAYFTDQMVSCVNSLGARRFLAQNGRRWFDHLDLLCLDEASQVLPQVALLGKPERRRDNHNALVNSIRTAAAVLIADADANEFLVQELKRIDPERRITVIEVEHPPLEQKRWDVRVTDSVALVRDELLRSVRAGERCLLATDNRHKAIVLERLIQRAHPSARILNIHREPSREKIESIRRFYDSPNAECQNYDVLIYSPAITSGVSITSEHFTRHFGIFTGIIKVNDAMQMLGRDRTSQKWLLALAPRNWAEARLKAGVKLESVGEAPTLFSELKHAADHYEIEARENLIVLAMNVLKMKGHKVTRVEPETGRNRQIDILMGSIANDMKFERRRRILSQEDITDAQYFDLKTCWMPSEDEAAAIQAYQIRHILCADLTEESISFFDQGGLKKVSLFETLQARDADIKRFEENQKATVDPSLRFYAADKRQILLEALSRLGLDPKDFSGEFTHANCQKVVSYFIENADRVNVIFEGIIDRSRPPRCATTFVQRIFRRLGLRLGARKSNGRMIRFVEPTDVELMLSLMERRRARQLTFIPTDPPAESMAA